MDDQDELFQVVDLDDRPLASRTRRECHADRRLLHRSVYVLVETAAGMLFQRRGWQKDTGAGLWDLACAGHAAAGEEPLAAARRELAEELGILGATPRALGRIVLDFPWERELCTVFRLTHAGPFTLRLPELIAIGVFEDDEWPAPRSPGAEQVLGYVRSLPRTG